MNYFLIEFILFLFILLHSDLEVWGGTLTSNKEKKVLLICQLKYASQSRLMPSPLPAVSDPSSSANWLWINPPKQKCRR